MRWLLTVSSVLLLLLASSLPCFANLLGNGGFETPALPAGSFQTINPGSEPAGFVWLVTHGNVDVGHLPISPFIEYSAFEASNALDMNGTTSGGIRQDFATVPGQPYKLSFVYADNSDELGISSASISVTNVADSFGLLTDSVSHSTSTNGPPADADWILYENTFIATGLLTRLAFASTSASQTASGGIALDAVDIIEVPEPATWLLMSVGVAGILALTRKRRTIAAE